MLEKNDIQPGHTSPVGIAFIIVVFLLVLLPVLPQVSTYHSDEHYYTNSAIYMLEHHEMLDPYYADGSLRTKKPIFAYWVLMAGYVLMGVNFFAARLPFLLAGGLTLWITYKVSRQLFAGRTRAVLSAVILASNLQFLALSVRATPDIIQCLFVMVSFYGFIALIYHRDLRLRNYAFAYFGAALAILTKGAIGVVLLVFILPFYGVIKERGRPFSEILHWPMMTVSMALAASWYLYILGAHGLEALGYFVSDQMTEKVGGSSFYVLSNIKDYLWGVFRNFLPWTLILLFAVRYRSVARRYFQDLRKESAIVLTWFLLLYLIFIGINDCRTRYLVPAYPLLSILLASVFTDLYHRAGAQRFWRGLSGVIAVVMALVSGLLLVLGLVLDKQLIIASVWILSGIAGGGYFLKRQGPKALPLVMGVVLLVTFGSLQGFVVPVFEFAPSRQMAACLLDGRSADTTVTIWSRGRANYLRQLYSLSNGRIMVEYFYAGKLPPDLGKQEIVVLTEEEKKSIDTRQYDVKPCGAIFEMPALNVLSKALLTGDKDTTFKVMQKTIYLARRLN